VAHNEARARNPRFFCVLPGRARLRPGIRPPPSAPRRLQGTGPAGRSVAPDGVVRGLHRSTVLRGWVAGPGLRPGCLRRIHPMRQWVRAVTPGCPDLRVRILRACLRACYAPTPAPAGSRVSDASDGGCRATHALRPRRCGDCGRHPPAAVGPHRGRRPFRLRRPPL